jgi:hypothetical protein
VSISLRSRIRQAFLLGCVSGAALLFAAAGSAAAATTSYPAGGSGFNGGAEGWTPGGASCNLPLLCSAEAAYEGGVGNPAGSIAAKTTSTLNLVNLFSGTVVWNSPEFTVPVGTITGARLRLERAFNPGGLVNVLPKATYVATVKDLTTGGSGSLSGELSSTDTTFTTNSAALNVTGGHRYQISIETTTAQSVVALSLLTSTATVRFDNVALEVQTADSGPSNPGGNGGNGDNGSNGGNGTGTTGGNGAGGKTGANGGAGANGGRGVSSARLESLIKSSGMVGAVRLKGNRLSVKAKCPAKLHATCTLRLQGMLSRKKPATAARRARVKQGKVKNFAMVVKPAARKKVKKRKRILVKEIARVGKSKATVYKSLKLVRK